MKTNSKPRFNGIDLLIVIVILAIAFVGVYMFMPKNNASSDTEMMSSKDVKAIVQVEFTEKEEYLTNLPKEGDSVTIGVKEKMPAVVTKVDITPAEKISYDLVNGSASWQEVPGKYDIYVTMEADAVETQGEIAINGSAIRIGDDDAVRAKGWAGYGFITQLDVEDK